MVFASRFHGPRISQRRPCGNNALSIIITGSGTAVRIAVASESAGPGVDPAVLRIDWTAGDDDNDGMPDTWEIQYFGSTNSGAYADWDLDGFANYFEYRAGTDPTNGASALQIEGVASGPGEMVLQWQSVSGRVYSILNNGSITSAWSTLRSGIPATPPMNTITESVVNPAGYWRIKLD